MPFRGRRLAGPLLSLVTTLLTLLVLEVGARGVGAWRRALALRDPTVPIYIVPDDRLGWRPMPNRDVAVGDREGRLTTDARGWRRFDAAAGRPPLVVLGDSFTAAAGVPDGATYWDVVGRRLSLPVVALGVNGYGTLQELLVARELRSELGRPAAVLLQMTDNDAINDSWELERRSWINNNLLPRPYLESGGRVAVRDPRRAFERLALGRELTRGILATRLRSIEDGIEAGDERAVELYRRELGATGEALRRLRALFEGVPGFVFDVSGGDGRIGADLLRLASDAGFRRLDVVAELGRRADGREITQADRAHWNELGHQLAGEILGERIAAALASAEGRVPTP